MSTLELTPDEVETLYYLAFYDSTEWLLKSTDDTNSPLDRDIYRLIYEERKALRQRLEALRTPRA